MEDMQKFSPVHMEGSISDDCGKTEIVQILISHYEFSIHSIQFVYAVDGSLRRSEIYGKAISQNRFAAVGFDYPREYIVSVSGWHEGSSGLASITFGTNKRMYGPFGTPDLQPDNYHDKFDYYFTPKSSFGGFHGSVRYSSSVSIGVYIKPVVSLVESMTNNSIEKNSSKHQF